MTHKSHPYSIVEGCDCGYCTREQMKLDSGLNEEEFLIMEHLTAAWNGFIELPLQHGSDIPEFQSAVHKLQHLVGMRIVRKQHDRFWFNMEATREK